MVFIRRAIRDFLKNFEYLLLLAVRLDHLQGALGGQGGEEVSRLGGGGAEAALEDEGGGEGAGHRPEGLEGPAEVDLGHGGPDLPV